jgi:hypothetical protein
MRVLFRMFERGAPAHRILFAFGLILLMAMPLAPVGAFGSEGAGNAGPRTVTDDANDLIVPAGETYELWGCHTYANSVWINGTLKVKPHDGSDATTGTLTISAASISVSSGGAIVADGRGYGGGGGASTKQGSGGAGGVGGKGGAGDTSSFAGGGGGGSNGGAGGGG